MEIIPAIDLIEGKCVRLTQGDYDQKIIYNENPLEVALLFEGKGVRRLHLVDLDGAKKSEVVNLKVLEKIANKTKLIIDFGGGIKSDGSIQSVFDAGASIATVGSVAVKNPLLFKSWTIKYGSDKILLGADVKNELISISGWLEDTKVNVFDFLTENFSSGIKNVFCTDISKDGKMEGPSLELYKTIIEKIKGINLIASGGVSKIEDVDKLSEIGCSGAIIGKALYENKITFDQLKPYLN